MATRRVVDSVSVRVAPDTRQFAEELRRFLRRQQAQLERNPLTVKIKPELDFVALRNVRTEIQRQLQDAISAKIKFDFRNIQGDLRLLQQEVDRHPIIITVRLGRRDEIRVVGQIGRLTRNRIMTIIPRLSQLALRNVQRQLASVGRITMSLTGVNVIRNQLQGLQNFFENLDRNALRLVNITTAVSTLAASIGLLTANFITLTASLLPLANVVLLVPGALLGLAAAAFVTQQAFKGIGDAVTGVEGAMEKLGPSARAAAAGFKEIYDSFVDLQPQLQEIFFAGLGDQIGRIADTVIPRLQAGLRGTASALNTVAEAVFTGIEEISNLGVIERVFDGINQALVNMAPAFESFINGFGILADATSSWLPEMATWVAEIAQSFDDWAGAASASGRIDELLENASRTARDLGQALINLTRIFSGLSAAGNKAGTTTISTLADVLGSLADVVESPEFQKGLSTILLGFKELVAGITGSFGDVGRAVGILAPTLRRVFNIIGDTLGDIISTIADSLTQPAFREGLVGFFQGFADGIQGLLPYLPSIVKGISALGKVIGEVVTQLGPTIGVLLGTLGDGLDKLAPDLIKIVQLLGGALRPVAEGLGTVIVGLANSFVTVLSALGPLIESLGKLAGGILTELGRGLTAAAEGARPLYESLGRGLADALTELIPKMIELAQVIANELIKHIPELVSSFLELVPAVTRLATKISEQLVQAITDLIPQMPALIQGMVDLTLAFTDLLIALEPMIPFMERFISLILIGSQGMSERMGILTSQVQKAVDIIKIFTVQLRPLLAALGLVDSALQDSGRIWDSTWNLIARVTNTKIGSILGLIGGVPSGILSALAPMQSSVPGVFRNMMGAAADGISAGKAGINRATNGVISDINRILGTVVPEAHSIGQDVAEGMARGMRELAWSVRDAAAALANATLAETRGVLRSHSPSRAMEEIGRDAGLGYVIGLEAMRQRAAAAGGSLAQNVLDAAGPGVLDAELNVAGSGYIQNQIFLDKRQIALAISDYTFQEKRRKAA